MRSNAKVSGGIPTVSFDDDYLRAIGELREEDAGKSNASCVDSLDPPGRAPEKHEHYVSANREALGPYAEAISLLLNGAKQSNGMTGVHRKLTKKEVREIRSRVEAGESGRSVAKSLGLGPATVYDIVNRKRYAWVD